MADKGHIAGSSIYDAARTCSELFQQLLISIENESERFILVEELRGRFGLWVAYVGVYAAPKASLDARLDNHNKIKGIVLELVDMVKRNLQWELVVESNSNPESQNSQGSEADDVDDALDVLGLSAAEAAIDRLLILAVAIRRSSRRMQAPKNGTNNENAISLCCLLVRARYPNARQSLCNQLGASIYQRGASLLYLKRHNQKLAFERHGPNMPTDDADQAIFSEDGSDEPDNSNNHPRVDFKSRAMVPETLPSVLSPSVASKVTKTMIKPSGSIMSQGWTIKDDRGESFYYPKRPELNSDQKYHICHLCGDPLEESDLTKEAWEAHVDHDLEPYVCISEECRDPPRFFARRRDWLDHMQTRHSITWSDKIHTEQWYCDVGHDTPLEFDSIDPFVKHLSNEHGNELSKSKLEGRARRNRRIATRDPFVCPFCGCIPSDLEPRVREKLSQHIAIHLKSLAFLSLSFVEEDTGDKNSTTESFDIDDKNDAKISRTSIINRNLESFHEIPETEILDNGARRVDEYEFSGEPPLLDASVDWGFLPESITQPNFQVLASRLRSTVMNEANPDHSRAHITEPESSVGAFQKGFKVWYDLYDTKLAEHSSQDDKHHFGAGVDICFIHGFIGNRDNTWVVPGSPEPWPLQFLAPKLPSARLLAWGYDAPLVRSEPTRIIELLKEWANIFVNGWKSSTNPNQGLILVAHSDGGLLCKKIFQIMRDFPYSRNLSRRLKGIIFINTTHIPNSKESLTYHDTHYEQVWPYASIHTEFMQIVEELDADEEIKIASLHTTERLRSTTIKGYRNITLSSIPEEEFAVSATSEFKFNAILELIQAWTTHFGFPNLRNEHSKDSIDESPSNIMKILNTDFHQPASRRLTRTFEMFHSFFDLFKTRLVTTTLSHPQIAFEIKQLIVSGIMLVEVSDNIHQHSNTEYPTSLPEFHRLLQGLTLFTRNTLFKNGPELDITSQSKSALLNTLATCDNAAMDCYTEAKRTVEKVGDIEFKPKKGKSHLIDLSFLDIIIGSDVQEPGVSKSSTALSDNLETERIKSNLILPLPAPTDDEISDDEHSLISKHDQMEIDNETHVSRAGVITEAEARARLSTVVIVRLVKIADSNEVDDEGDPTRPSWEKVQVTVKDGISQQKARQKIRNLDETTESVLYKKANCPLVIQRQLERAQEDLYQNDTDKRYQFSLLQFESKFKRLVVEDIIRNTNEGNPKNKEIYSSISKNNEFNQMYDRISIQAYFQRAPTQHQDCIRMLKDQGMMAGRVLRQPQGQLQVPSDGVARTQYPTRFGDGPGEEDIPDVESDDYDTDWDWVLSSPKSMQKKATSEHIKVTKQKYGMSLRVQSDLIPAFNYLCHMGEAKVWIERVIGMRFPVIFELDQALSDGVILAELAQALSPASNFNIIRDHRRLTRHTSNATIFLRYLDDIMLPKRYHFELMDLVEKRNIPRVIYCIHALGWFLYEMDTVEFGMECLVGALHFEAHQLEKAREVIDKLGDNMPDFEALAPKESERVQGSDHEERSDTEEEEVNLVASDLPPSFGPKMTKVLSDIQAYSILKENKDSVDCEARKKHILAVSSENFECLDIHDAGYFEMHCQKLFDLIKAWVHRFSKASDIRLCRLKADINDESITYRLETAILDGTNIDEFLKDRVKRRHVFICVAVGMIWEYIFTRYLFGIDQATRRKLKGFEKSLTGNTEVEIVRRWRAVTLALLTTEEVFPSWRDSNTEAVTQQVFQFFTRLLPPPSHLEEELRSQLHEVMVEMVDISIQMRCQLAEFMMLPPLQPEYDDKGELAQVIGFNASLMVNTLETDLSQEDLEAQNSNVSLVYFPLVVQKGDDDGKGDDEVVVYPAQVLVSQHIAEIKDGATSDMSDVEE